MPLLLPEPPAFSPASLQSVTVETPGEVQVGMCWRRMHRIGTAFADERSVQAQLSRVFRAIGQCPQ